VACGETAHGTRGARDSPGSSRLTVGASLGRPRRRSKPPRPGRSSSALQPAGQAGPAESWSIAASGYVNKREYADLKGGVIELLRRYPRTKYFFVGLGRDPAPVIAFLQNLGEKQLAVNLPAPATSIGRAPACTPRRRASRRGGDSRECPPGQAEISSSSTSPPAQDPGGFRPPYSRLASRTGRSNNARREATLLLEQREGPQQIYARRLTDWIDTNAWEDFSKYYGDKYEGDWWIRGSGELRHREQHERRSQMGAGVTPPR